MLTPLDTPLGDLVKKTPGPLAMLLSPTFWLMVVLWTGAVAVTAGHVAADQVRTEAQRDEAQRSARALQAQIDADAAVLARERRLRMEDNASFAAYKEEKANELASKNRLVACLESGACRLRVPTVIRAPGPAAPDAGRPAAAGTGDEGHAELTPDAAAQLVGLLTRGDDAIRKHAAVVDRYERLRTACTSTTHQGDSHDGHHENKSNDPAADGSQVEHGTSGGP